MSFTTSFFGGGPLGFGTTGFDFVSLRLVEACGGGGVVGAGPAGICAGLASEPPQPATASEATASSVGMWERLITAAQASDPAVRRLRARSRGSAGRDPRSRSGARARTRAGP